METSKPYDEILLEVSLRLFTEIGYENTGVAAIVSEAGVTKPTMYHYFGNKEGLLVSLLDLYGKGMLELFEAELSYQGDVNGSLERLVIAYMNYVKRRPMFFRLYHQLNNSPWQSDSNRLIMPLQNAINNEVLSFFETVAKHHTNLQGKTSWMSFSLIGLMDTYMLKHLREDTLDTVNDTSCRLVAKQFLYGVFA